MQHRRDFIQDVLKRSSAIIAATTLSSLPTKNAKAKDQAPSDRLRIGCIGTGGRGSYVSSLAAKHGEIAMICDVDLRRAEEAKNRFKADKATIVQDYRRVLDNKDIDIVVQGGPDHWHTKINIEACRAGKDVYAEKPLTLTIEEGKLLRKVVAQTRRIVQVGTQQRSGCTFQTAIELIRAGRLGRLKTVCIALPHYGVLGGPFPSQDVPKELDWDLFQGQAPVAPYCEARARRWRQWYEYAGGNVTDWGNHHTDIALWGLRSENSGPVSVEARGLFPQAGKADCFNVVGKFCSRMKYIARNRDEIDLFFFEAIGKHWKELKENGNAPTTAEQFDFLFGKDCPDEIKEIDRDGVMFIGEKGRLFVNRGGVYGKAVDELKDRPLPKTAWKAPHRQETEKPNDSTDWHMTNFFDCVRSRKQPVASVDLEHRAVTLCHLTNISLRLGGRKIQWDPKAEQIVGDEEAKAMQGRDQREPYTIS